MKRRTLTLSFLATALLAFSIAGTGCKKEEPKEPAKVSTTEPAKASEPAKAPESSANGIFRAQITVDAPLQKAKAGATVTLPVKVKNVSGEKWTRDKANPIHLSYHWRNAVGGKAVIWDGTRTLIAKDVAPGEEIALNAKVTAPKEPGQYNLELDMVKDGTDGGWFNKKGSEIPSMQVTVK